VYVCEATTQRASVWTKGHLFYKERRRELLATVRKLDEKMDGAATSWVVLGNDMQILEGDISMCKAASSFRTYHLNSL
jgi:hypothetical protein